MTPLGEGFFGIVLNCGFSDEIDVPRELAGVALSGGPIRIMSTSFFLGRQS